MSRLLVVSCLLISTACASSAPVQPIKSTTQAPSSPEVPLTKRKAMLERAIPCIVTLRLNYPVAFALRGAGASSGTGFIVDVERGIILTNRHLIQPAPVNAFAVLNNQEELALEEIYYDVVHDFGFYRFDPTKVKFAKLCELPLAPDEAKVGKEVFVVGNDAGEKISILDSTLARLDRNAPNYGSKSYTDFNTFYYQSASGTSGGSSGSPVLDAQGRVVALNAGGSRRAASSYYLPLHPVVDALAKIQKGEPIPRGTLQATFRHTPFNDLERLGLTDETQKKFRELAPQNTGLLKLWAFNRKGPLDGKLEEGDVLLSVNGEPVFEFWALEKKLNANVGESVTLEVERFGRRLKEEVKVDDLQSLSPRSYIQIGSTIFHALPYQLSRKDDHPTQGVVLARPGNSMFASLKKQNIIHSINGTEIKELKDLWKVLQSVPDQEYMRVSTMKVSSKGVKYISTVKMNRRFFSMRYCQRALDRGRWSCQEVDPKETKAGLAKASTFEFPPRKKNKDKLLEAFSDSFVKVRTYVPFPVEGEGRRNYNGLGLIVDSKQGLILTDRATVPIFMSDVTLEFRDLISIPAKVELVHPVHNLVLLSYDPKLLGPLKVRPVSFSSKKLQKEDKVSLVTMASDGSLQRRDTKVSKLSTQAMSFKGAPRYKQLNAELVRVQDKDSSSAGVLSDKRGKVQAVWLRFENTKSGVTRGIHTTMVQDFMARWREQQATKQPFVHYALGARVYLGSLASARKLKLDDMWTKTMLKANPKGKVLIVSYPFGGFEQSPRLLSKDVILTVEGEVVTDLTQLEKLSQKPKVTLEILRQGKVKKLTISTLPLDGIGVNHMLSWAGLYLHDTHVAPAIQDDIKRTGVYISFYLSGGIARAYGIGVQNRIVSVNGINTPDLKTFISVVKGFKHGESIRLKLLNLRDEVQVMALKLDLNYWPSQEIRVTKDGWTIQKWPAP